MTPLQVRIDGLTGHIQFNEKGRRTNYTVSIMELAPSGPKKVSLWPAGKAKIFARNGIILYAYILVDAVMQESVSPPLHLIRYFMILRSATGTKRRSTLTLPVS